MRTLVLVASLQDRFVRQEEVGCPGHGSWPADAEDVDGIVDLRYSR